MDTFCIRRSIYRLAYGYLGRLPVPPSQQPTLDGHD
eukprot:COSAG01_NODE_52620_length_345_cov_0.910569_1_plen_35_part_01